MTKKLLNLINKSPLIFTKTYEFCRSLFSTCELYIRYGLYLNSKSINKAQEKPEYIISLTSYHKRFPALIVTLKSLITQKTKYKYQIHVHLSNVDLKKKNLESDYFDNLCLGSKVKFFIHEENLLSYKKYFYTLKSNEDVNLITADDDIIYPSNWLEKLIVVSDENPGCVVCYRGHYLQKCENRENSFLSYNLISKNKTSCTHPSLWLLPTGVSGVLYPQGTIDTNIALDKSNFLEIAPKSDDFWLKLSTLSQGTKSMRVERYNKHFPHVLFTQSDSLASSNTTLGGNDKVLKALNDKYQNVFSALK